MPYPEGDHVYRINAISPMNRLEAEHPWELSDAEILSLVIGSGRSKDIDLACRVIGEVGSLTRLGTRTVHEIRNTQGIGRILASRILASHELGRRLLSADLVDRAHITTPSSASNIFIPRMAHLEHEELRVMLLNSRNYLMGEPMKVAMGSKNKAYVSMRELFYEPIRRGAAAILAAHNHPSGDPSPSKEDIVFTKEMKQAGDLLDIPVLDHLIIGAGRFVSMREKRLGYE